MRKAAGLLVLALASGASADPSSRGGGHARLWPDRRRVVLSCDGAPRGAPPNTSCAVALPLPRTADLLGDRAHALDRETPFLNPQFGAFPVATSGLLGMGNSMLETSTGSGFSWNGPGAEYVQMAWTHLGDPTRILVATQGKLRAADLGAQARTFTLRDEQTVPGVFARYAQRYGHSWHRVLSTDTSVAAVNDDDHYYLVTYNNTSEFTVHQVEKTGDGAGKARDIQVGQVDGVENDKLRSHLRRKRANHDAAHDGRSTRYLSKRTAGDEILVLDKDVPATTVAACYRMEAGELVACSPP